MGAERMQLTLEFGHPLLEDLGAGPIAECRVAEAQHLASQLGRVVVDPTHPLIHHESASRQPVIEGWEWERFVGRWGEVVDPWYHPGHHRPDDPTDRRRNADGLAPTGPDGRWAPRTPTIRPRVHRARLQPPTDDPQG